MHRIRNDDVVSQSTKIANIARKICKLMCPAVVICGQRKIGRVDMLRGSPAVDRLIL